MDGGGGMKVYILKSKTGGLLDKKTSEVSATSEVW
jgi:hypothetical protein